MDTKLPARQLKKLEALLDADKPDVSELVKVDCDLCDQFNPNKIARDLSNLTSAQRGFYVSWWLEGEVNNGGFNQFLLNKGPVFAREAISFCESRGLAQLVDLLNRAIAALPGGVLPETHDELGDILVEDDEDDGPGPIEQAHNELDSIFYDSGLGEQLMLERLRFVREHADEFFK
ncbi:MAG: DUF4375 domain-containing protein [Phycisphaerales bacterium JB039]